MFAAVCKGLARGGRLHLSLAATMQIGRAAIPHAVGPILRLLCLPAADGEAGRINFVGGASPEHLATRRDAAEVSTITMAAEVML